MRRRCRDNAANWGPLHSLTSATVSLCTVYYCLGPSPPSPPPPTQRATTAAAVRSMLEPRWRPVQVQYPRFRFRRPGGGGCLARPPPRRIAPSPCRCSSYRPRGRRLIVAPQTSPSSSFPLLFHLCFTPLSSSQHKDLISHLIPDIYYLL